MAPGVAAQLSRCFGLLDAGLYRVEGGGVTSGFILPLGLMDGGGRKRLEGCRQDDGFGLTEKLVASSAKAIILAI